jgi:hypothetical protein
MNGLQAAFPSAMSSGDGWNTKETAPHAKEWFKDIIVRPGRLARRFPNHPIVASEILSAGQCPAKPDRDRRTWAVTQFL